MKLATIKVNTTSNKTADATGMVISNNTQYRVVFFPKLVENDKNQDECVEGCLVCQKKRKNEEWEDLNEISMKDIKIGEWTKFNIELGEMNNLLRYAGKLKELYDKEKSLKRITQKHIIILDEELTKEEIDNFNEFAKNNPEAITNLNTLLGTKVNLDKIAKSISENPSIIKEITEQLDDNNSQELYNNLKLKFINPNYLKNNIEKDDEEFWQNLFNKNPNILFSVIPSVGQIICQKPYMGGKAVDNKGGTISDFLYKCGTRNISIIEIKKPTTKLIGKEYRNGIYAPSDELSGAILQIKTQKDTLLKNYHNSKVNSFEEGIDFDAYDPKAYLIIGNSDKLNSKEIKSFELYRNSLKDIEIITFNELIKKLELVFENLSH